jgi:RimK family alpha-L-glutamate ligase
MISNPIKILWLDTEDLYSAHRAIQAGKANNLQVDCFDVSELRFVAGLPCSNVYKGNLEIVDIYDALIVRTFMPYICEVLTIAKLFREAGKVVVDASLTEEGYVMSKMHDYLCLSKNDIPVPRTYQCFDTNSVEEIATELGFPCILKGVHGSEGRHVFKIEDLSQLRRKICRYKAGELQIQEYLEADVDYRVMVIGYKALPVFVRRKPRQGDFRTNFEYNEEVTPLLVSEYPELRDLAENAAKVLRREFSGVDIRFRKDQPLVLEANRRPGFKDFEQTTGFDVAGEFIRYVASRCAGES